MLLPYEYQLRENTEEIWKPQELLAAYMKQKGIDFVDTGSWFLKNGKKSRTYFLYGDPMHLSREGHRVVYEGLRKLGDEDPEDLALPTQSGKSG